MSHLTCRLAPWGLLLVAACWLPAETDAAEAQKKPVILEVTVPPTAEVYIDGAKTNKTGPKRTFISPEVEIDKKYYYTIKAVWKGPDGKEVVREIKKFYVTPGKVNVLDLTKEPKEEPKISGLKLDVPALVTVDAGGKKAIPLKLTRENLKGAVKVAFSGLPPGVKIGPVTIPADKNAGSAEVTADKDAKAGSVDVAVRAESGKVEAMAKLKLSVKAAPPPPAKLTLEVPAMFDVDSDSKKPLPVKVKRENVTGPVKVTFSFKEPKDVKIAPLTIPADKSEGQAEVSVDKGAKAGSVDVTIQAESGTTKTQTATKLNIKAAKPKDK